MLTIVEVTGQTHAKDYYAVSDYYGEGQETVGHWGGKLAGLLGRSGKVTQQAFERMVDNLHPETGKRLTARTKDNRRVGYDFTVSQNKSVSILRAFASEDDGKALDAARDRAIAGMMARVEADMQCRERRNGADHDITTGNLAYAAFHHTTARPVAGQPPDPNEHSHLLVFNATQRADGRILAGQFAGLKRDGEYFSAVFDALYARELEKLGFRIERQGGKKWKVAGITDAMIATFSKRKDEIETEAERRGIVDARRKAELGAKTRSKKQKELTPEQLRQAWGAQLTDADRAALLAVYRRDVKGGAHVTAAQAVEYAIADRSEQLSVIPEKDLKRVALLYGLGDVTPEQIDHELTAPRHGLIVQEIDGRNMATTAKLQAEEDAIVSFAARGKGSVAAVGVPAELKRGKLNDGQWAAVTGLLDSENRVNVVVGPAGAGKTAMLRTFEAGMKMAGRNVGFLATTSDAVAVLAQDGFTDAKTMAHFLLDEKLQNSLRNGTIVCDEGSMLGHKDALRFFGLADKLNLNVTIVGDPLQHGSVPRGALLKILKDYAGIREFRLHQIMRQKHAGYLAAAEQLSEGKTLAGFNALDALGWVSEIRDDSERYKRLAAEYVQAMDDNTSLPEHQRVLAVSPTHREAAAITQEIRSQMRVAGKLGAEDHEFTRLVAVNASEPERGQATTFRPGDVLQFHQNAPGFTKGQRLTVTDPAAVPLEHAARFSLYRTEKIALAEGDRIRFTGTVKTTDGEHTLKNGKMHTIAGFTPGGHIRLDNGWVVSKDAGHFRHGFVETSFGSQGKTVKRVLLGMSASSIGATNQEQMYVSASRGTDRLTLYTDDKAALRSGIQRSSRKLAALDLRQPPKVTPWRRNWERLRQQFDRQRRAGYVERLRGALGSVRRPTVVKPALTGIGGSGSQKQQDLTQAQRVRLQQERERGHGR